MTRKRFSRPPPRPKAARRHTTHQSGAGRHQPIGAGQLEAEIIAFLHGHGTPATLGTITAGIELPRAQRKVMQQLLNSMCRQQQLSCSDNKTYALAKAGELLEAVLDVNPRGFGFATLVENAGKPRERGTDLFIPSTMLGSAHHGDRVLLQPMGSSRGRVEARVVRVVQRAMTRLVGLFFAGSPMGYVEPEDERFAFKVLVPKQLRGGAKQGEAVVVEIVDFKGPGQPPEGRIAKVLGDPDDLEVQTKMVIHAAGLPDEFNDQVMAEVDNLPDADADTMLAEAGRVDLRQIPHVTIDGASARDFDDAIAVRKTKQGFQLHVSIADVSHYVRPNTALDGEAYERGTSVYFPTRAVPMLPERLSTDLCSLMPNQDRPAFTAILDFDRKGRRIGASFTLSLIKSHYRLTYDLVRDIMTKTGPDYKALQLQYKAILTPLAWARQLAILLEEQRMARGSLGFSMPAAVIEIGPDNRVGGISRASRHFAHKMIEEFMLAANEAVAETFAEHKQPLLYRIHERPDAVKVAEFVEFARTMGLQLPKGETGPAWFAEVLAGVAGSPREYIVNNLLLRTMQRACYAPGNVGHFGLAAQYYCHFTSPIRRYPDLMVHRALKELLGRAARHGRQQKQKKAAAARDGGVELQQAGEFLSNRERRAMEAERGMVSRLQARFMADKVGEQYVGVISGVTSFGLFVELVDWMISGAAPIASLRDDYYHYDDKTHRLLGKRSGRVFQLGNLVRVTVASVDLRLHRVNFHHVEPVSGAEADPPDATPSVQPGNKPRRKPATRKRR